MEIIRTASGRMAEMRNSNKVRMEGVGAKKVEGEDQQ